MGSISSDSNHYFVLVSTSHQMLILYPTALKVSHQELWKGNSKVQRWPWHPLEYTEPCRCTHHMLWYFLTHKPCHSCEFQNISLNRRKLMSMLLYGFQQLVPRSNSIFPDLTLQTAKVHSIPVSCEPFKCQYPFVATQSGKSSLLKKYYRNTLEISTKWIAGPVHTSFKGNNSESTIWCIGSVMLTTTSFSINNQDYRSDMKLDWSSKFSLRLGRARGSTSTKLLKLPQCRNSCPQRHFAIKETAC